MKYSILPLLIIFTLALNAQVQRIIPNDNVKITSGVNKINLPETSRIKPKTKRAKIEYLSMESPDLNSFKMGLKPGKLNDRKVPTYIEGQLNNSGSPEGTVMELATEYLYHASKLMKIKDPKSEFRHLSTETDELGMSHIRYQQEIQGVVIYGAEIIVHAKEKKCDFLNGRYFPSFQMESVIPAIQTNTALEFCLADLGKIQKYGKDVEAFFNPSTTSTDLVIYPHDDAFLLAYHITIYKNMGERWEYFIDGNSGKTINKFQSICKFHNHIHTNDKNCAPVENTVILDGKATANALDLFSINREINTYQVGNKYYLIDGSRDIYSSTPSQLPNDPSGVIWTIDAFNTSPQKDDFKYDHVTTTNNVWNNKTAVSSHYNGGKAYEYFRNVHNRKSISGDGGNIVSIINVADEDGSSMGNAFWNGQAMFYGNGDGAFLPLARGLDVAGHEMTHGVVESTANLEYQGEAGALNESFADVFGVLIDREDWKIGEDVVKAAAFPSGALRNMENPHNGAQTNDFNAGWQPKIYSERYKGADDNGGVHLNSGIPNHAFFLFATAIGKDKAEKVYYRALSTYLTKSSQFVDCRIAVIKAATDLFGVTEINAAKKAFDDVGILGEQGGDYEVDNEVNPGEEFILATNSNEAGLFLYDTNGNSLGTVSNSELLSKPSISDDGSEIVFVGTDSKIHYIYLDWDSNPVIPEERIIANSPIWRNAIISKDGLKIAALNKDKINEIEVYYFDANNNTLSNTFTLYNPTYAQGVSTGDVNYAEAMEFDLSGEYIMYDAENEIKSTNSGSITYWDISFLKVWNNSTNTFSLGKIEKLFTDLPEDVSIGNPAFSKNSPYILAFDYIDENGEVSIVGTNTESGTTKLIFENNTFGYPNYSSQDNKLIFDNEGTSAFNTAIVNLKTNKIEPSASPTLLLSNRHWAVWFSTGKRNLSASEDVDMPLDNQIQLLSNPVTENVNLNIYAPNRGTRNIIIIDALGKTSYQKLHQVNEGNNSIFINTEDYPAGQYFITISDTEILKSMMFVKIK